MSSIKCPTCGLTNWATAISCKRCGFLFQPGEINAESESLPPENFGDQSYSSVNQSNFDNSSNFESGAYNSPNQTSFAGYNQSYRQANHQSYHRQNYKPANPKIGMAVTSMVLGLVGCFLTAPIGLILGIVSLVKANRRPFEYGGKGFAIAGIILNAFGVLVLPIIAAIAIPNLLAARRAANEGAAIASLRTIYGAEITHMSVMAGNRCGDLKTLGSESLLEPALASGEKSGYRFMVVSLPTADGGCEIHATPISASHGTRSFYYSTEEGIIRAAAKNGLFAGASDPPVESYNSYQKNLPPKVSNGQQDLY